MIRYVYDEDERLVSWAEAHLGRGHRLRKDAKTIGIEVDGHLRAVTAFDNFSLNDCVITVVSDGGRRWFTREYAVRTMVYPFVQCEFHRVTCLISASNKESISFTRRFGGWKLEGVLREAGIDGEDILIYGMLKRDCLWLTLPKQTMAV